MTVTEWLETLVVNDRSVILRVSEENRALAREAADRGFVVMPWRSADSRFARYELTDEGFAYWLEHDAKSAAPRPLQGKDGRMVREADVTLRLRGVEGVLLTQMCAEALKQALNGDDLETALLFSDMHGKVVRAVRPELWDEVSA